MEAVLAAFSLIRFIDIQEGLFTYYWTTRYNAFRGRLFGWVACKQSAVGIYDGDD